MSEAYGDLISKSNVAFGSGQFQIALELAQKAIQINAKQADGYYCAGRAYMSQSMPQEASECFSEAIKHDPKNGNGFFFLAYSQILSGNTVMALGNLTRSIENVTSGTVLADILSFMRYTS